MTQRQNMAGKTASELTHSIKCVIWWLVLTVSESSQVMRLYFVLIFLFRYHI